MRLHTLASTSFALVLLSGFCIGCTVDGATGEPEDEVLPTVGPANGGFHGVAACPNVDRKIDLSLTQDFDDNDVDGRIFIETNVRYIDGLVDVVLGHVVAGDLVDGELDGATLTGIVLTETTDGRATAPDFSIAFDVATDSDGAATAFSGIVSQLDGNNEPIVDCDVDIVPTSEPRP